MATGLTPAYVVYLMNQGRRQTDIAEEFGVSRQYVNKLAKRGGHEPVVTLVTENFPWPINESMYPNTLYQSLRLLGHYQLDPNGLTGSSRVKLRGFLRKIKLFNQVVDYDPSYPAIPGANQYPRLRLRAPIFGG